jgi:hypothetical protein
LIWSILLMHYSKKQDRIKVVRTVVKISMATKFWLYESWELNSCDRTILSPFINQQPFYPQTSLEKLPRTAPPLSETTKSALTSLTFLFYKSHAWPRFAAAPYFPWPAWQFGPAIKLCCMDMRLFSWAFFVSGVFPNILCHDSDQVALPALSLLSWPPPPHPSLSLSQLPFPSSRIWAALPGPPILKTPLPHQLTGKFLYTSALPTAIHHRPIFPQGPLSLGEYSSHAEL